MTDDRPGPVARPTLSRGDLYVFDDEDLADASAELFAWTRELNGVSDADAEEISTMMYEILTEGWLEQLES